MVRDPLALVPEPVPVAPLIVISWLPLAAAVSTVATTVVLELLKLEMSTV